MTPRLLLSLTVYLAALPAFGGRRVSIPDTLRVCERDAECTKVSIDCNECCGEDAVRKSAKAAYEKRFAEKCRDYKGPVCDCVPADTSPRCVKRQCRLVPNRKGAVAP